MILNQRNNNGTSGAWIQPLLVIAMLIVTATSSLAFGLQPARTACLYLTDWSGSPSPSHVQIANEFLVETILEQADWAGCGQIVIRRFSSAASFRFAQARWLDLPTPPEDPHCEQVEPELPPRLQFVGTKLRNMHEGLRNRARRECEQQYASVRGRYHEERLKLAQELKAALAVDNHVKSSSSAILDVLRAVIDERLYSFVVVVTDGVQHPPAPMTGLTVPEGMQILMIVVPPTKGQHSVTESLKSIDAWSAIPGVTVVTLGQLHAGFWNALDRRSQRVGG